MTELDDAERVAAQLAKRLEREPWLEGVAVDFDDEEQFAVSVRVSTDPADVELPERIEGVLVRVVRRKRARGASR